MQINKFIHTHRICWDWWNLEVKFDDVEPIAFEIDSISCDWFSIVTVSYKIEWRRWTSSGYCIRPVNYRIQPIDSFAVSRYFERYTQLIGLSVNRYIHQKWRFRWDKYWGNAEISYHFEVGHFVLLRPDLAYLLNCRWSCSIACLTTSNRRVDDRRLCVRVHVMPNDHRAVIWSRESIWFLCVTDLTLRWFGNSSILTRPAKYAPKRNALFVELASP